MFAEHLPVMPREVLELLAVSPGAVVVDATVGQGGHAELLLQHIGPSGLLIGLDVDEHNLRATHTRLQDAENVRLFHENFEHLPKVLSELNVTTVDAILADLGVSSAQLGDPQRGLSFQTDGPLDMRLDPRLDSTAADLVNRLPESELADVLYQFGQERRSRRIARAIHLARRKARISRTAVLADIVCGALGQDPGSRRAKIHPATRTFMALRIAVNRELEVLTNFLKALPAGLRTGGRAAVISFHSLEDGLCKRAFRTMHQDGAVEILTRKPLTPDPQERRQNPRSRSAKLRAVRRLAMD